MMKKLQIFAVLIAAMLVQASPSFAFDWDKSVDASVLQKIKTKSGLRVLWWNVHDGKIAEGDQGVAFNHNIYDLIHSTIAPDVISLAEYQESDLSPMILKELERLYPNHILQEYPGAHLFGLGIYSKYPFDVSSLDLLDITPLKAMSDAERDAYRTDWCKGGMCVRPMLILNLKMNGKSIKLVPIHFFDCWREVMNRVGKVGTLKEIIIGKENPLLNQILRFRQILESKLGSELVHGNVAIFGDFNTPEKLLGLSTIGYEKISAGLKDATEGNDDTFPSLGSQEHGHFPSMQIDHALASPALGVAAGEVLPLRGSDHYPLYLILSP